MWVHPPVRKQTNRRGRKYFTSGLMQCNLYGAAFKNHSEATAGQNAIVLMVMGEPQYVHIMPVFGEYMVTSWLLDAIQNYIKVIFKVLCGSKPCFLLNDLSSIILAHSVRSGRHGMLQILSL